MTGDLKMGNKDIIDVNKITAEDNIICRGNLYVNNNILVVKGITANDDIKSLWEGVKVKMADGRTFGAP